MPLRGFRELPAMKLGYIIGPIERDDLIGPGQLIGYSLTLRLRRCPQLQVLDAIIVTDAVDVVDVLVRQKSTAKKLFHDETMLELVLSPAVNSSGSMYVPSVH